MDDINLMPHECLPLLSPKTQYGTEDVNFFHDLYRQIESLERKLIPKSVSGSVSPVFHDAMDVTSVPDSATEQANEDNARELYLVNFPSTKVESKIASSLIGCKHKLPETDSVKPSTILLLGEDEEENESGVDTDIPSSHTSHSVTLGSQVTDSVTERDSV